MSRRLKSSPARLCRAAILGVLTPTVLLYLFVSFVAVTEAQDHIARSKTFVAALMLTLLVIWPGAPAWAVMHRLGVKLPWAAALGATLGALEGLLGAYLARDNYPPGMLLALNAGFMVLFALIGAAVTTIVWVVAYPARLQPRLSETFA